MISLQQVDRYLGAVSLKAISLTLETTSPSLSKRPLETIDLSRETTSLSNQPISQTDLSLTHSLTLSTRPLPCSLDTNMLDDLSLYLS